MEKLIHSFSGKALFFAILATLSLSGFGAELTRKEVGWYVAKFIPSYSNDRTQNREMKSVLSSVAKIESGNNTDAKSGANAEGLFQLIPLVWEHFNVNDPKDPYENTRAAVEHWMTYFKMCRSDPVLTLAAWNSGQATVYRHLQRVWEQSVYGQMMKNSSQELEAKKVKTDCSPSPWDGRVSMSELKNICRDRFRCFSALPNQIDLEMIQSCKNRGHTLSEFYAKRLHTWRVPNILETQNFVLKVVEDYCQNMTHPGAETSGVNQKLQGE